MTSLTHASADLPKVVLGEANLNKFNSPDKMMAHLTSLVEAESKNDSKFSFKLTQISSASNSNSYTSPIKKHPSISVTSSLDNQLYYFDQFIAN